MQKRKLIALSALALAAGGAYLYFRNKAKKRYHALPVVPDLDIEKYLGKWYDIAHLPASFQKGCFNTQAVYSLEANGSVKVVNTCNKGSVHGREDRVEGCAKVDPSSNAKLKVTFFWPFKGDYWILDVGSNYDYALVGEPSRKYLWILSRQPFLDETIFDRLIDYANELGYSTNRLIMTNHKVI